MKFFQKLKFVFNSHFDEYVRAFLTGEDYPGGDTGSYIDSRTAMTYTAVFACVRVLSETLAGTPAMLYRKKENGERESRTDLAVYDILHNRPNEEMSPLTLKRPAWWL